MHVLYIYTHTHIRKQQIKNMLQFFLRRFFYKRFFYTVITVTFNTVISVFLILLTVYLIASLFQLKLFNAIHLHPFTPDGIWRAILRYF